MKQQTLIEKFIDKNNIFAVVGVSNDKTKYGRKVFDDLKRFGYEVYPVNPKIEFISKDKCYLTLKDLPAKPDVVSFVVPSKVVENLIVECKKLGIDKVWLQPGSESEKVLDYCKNNNIECLHNQCIMLNLN